MFNDDHVCSVLKIITIFIELTMTYMLFHILA